MADNGGIRIGGGDIAAVHSVSGLPRIRLCRLGLCRVTALGFQPPLQLPVPGVEVPLERVGINDGVVSGIGIDEA